MNQPAPIVDELRNRFDDTILMQQPTRDDIPTIWCTADGAPDILQHLKNMRILLIN